MSALLPDKKVKLDLVGLDGNAFVLIGTFRKEARKQGWDADEIQAVSDLAMSGDYNNVLKTLLTYTTTE